MLKVKTATMTALIDGVLQDVTVLLVDTGGTEISFNGKTATISNLAGTTISYSGKTVTIGGN